MVVAALLFVQSLVLTQVHASEASQHLWPFTTDGCSMFPDGSFSDATLWRSCCVDHDLAYWRGGTYADRFAADEALLSCVAEKGEPAVALTMMLGVRVGGSPFWPTDFRWAYGWKKWRGYGALSERDIVLLEAMLSQ